MLNLKKFGTLAIVAFALSAIGAANASAAQFTASATGSFSGKATSNQVFTTNGGTITCPTAASSGTISSTATTQLHETVIYGTCVGPFGVTVHVSPATFLTTADGVIHLLNQVTMVVTPPFGVPCHITYNPQTWKPVSYTNNGGKLKVTANVTAMTYTTTGGFCGSGGANGTLAGTSEIERVGGGSISWDA